MAQKPKKKPRHGNLVLPGEKDAKKGASGPPSSSVGGTPPKDRLGRATPVHTRQTAATHRFESGGAEGDGPNQAPATTPSLFDMEASEVESPAPPPRGTSPRPTVAELLEAETRPAAVHPSPDRPATTLRNTAPPVPPTGRTGSAPPPDRATAAPPAGNMADASNNTQGAVPSSASARQAGAQRRFESGGSTGQDTNQVQGAALPDNAIRLPATAAARRGAMKRGPRYNAARRKKRNRRIGVLVAVVLVLVGILVYVSGLYLNVAMVATDLGDSVRLALTPGDGYPTTFVLPGYITSEKLGRGGFAAVGEKDFVLYSSTGAQLSDLQHGYANPGITAGNTRVCLYERGGKEYSIEGRGKTLARRTASQEILFAEMSPGGWLALVTTSRYNITLEVYNALYDVREELSWDFPIVDEMPVLAAFHPDNRTLALGCLQSHGGALGTSIHILRVGHTEVLATIDAPDARLVQAQFTSAGRLLALFDTHAALYDTGGAELARYDYGGRGLLAADVSGTHTALTLGSSARETLDLVLLDGALSEAFSATAENVGSPQVLATSSGGALLLLGQGVLAYDATGALNCSYTLEQKALGLVDGSGPLALCAGTAQPLGWMLEPGASSHVAASAPTSAGSAPASASGGSSAPTSTSAG